MATARPYASIPLFVANTDMKSYRPMHRGEASPSAFRHWLSTGRLYVTPDDGNPDKYAEELKQLVPGSVVFAQENRVGIVAMGLVGSAWDRQTHGGGTALYPKGSQMVQWVDVAWDTSVTLPYKDILAAGGALNGKGLRPLINGQSRKIAERLYESALLRQRSVGPDEVTSRAEHATVSERDRECLARYRVGQQLFRARVLLIEPVCRVTGIADPAFLRASHIKPWVACEGGEHLDAHNGLMLAPHVDHLFDRGFITFGDDGQMKMADNFDRAILQAWNIDETVNVGQFNSQQATILPTTGPTSSTGDAAYRQCQRAI